MKHKRVYEDCKNLVFYGETIIDSKNFKCETYLDSFGCDLQVYRIYTLSYETDAMEESIEVYSGGRKVYSFNDKRPDKEYIVNGHWERLISELWHHELARHLGESYTANGTLLELCRKEAMRNRKIMNKYREFCVLLAKEKGKIPEGARHYKFEEEVDGHTMKVYMSESVPKENASFEGNVELTFDKKNVFSFYFDSSDIGGLYDDKGNYIPGEWEKILEQLMEKL